MNREEWISNYRELVGQNPSDEHIREAIANGQIVDYIEQKPVESESVSSGLNSEPNFFSNLGKVASNSSLKANLLDVIKLFDKKWLFRQYFISAIFALFLHSLNVEFSVLFILLCVICNPFTRYVWINFTNWLFGPSGIFIFLPLTIMIMVQLITYMVVFVFSTFVKTVVFLYYYLKLRKNR